MRLLLIAFLVTALLILPIPAVWAQHDSGHHDDGSHHDSNGGHHESNDYHADAGAHLESSVSQPEQVTNDLASSVNQPEPTHPAADVVSEVTGPALPGVCGDSPELLAALALPVTAQLRLACHWPAESETP